MTPSGKEVRGHLRRLIRRIRRHWPATRITLRGDGHYSRPEVMAWCEDNGIDFIFGRPGNATLDRAVDEAADDLRTRRALDHKPARRGGAATRYQAKSWKRRRCAGARIEATTRGLDIRSLPPRRRGSPAWSREPPNTSPRRSIVLVAKPKT